MEIYNELPKNIIENIGGAGNIVSAVNCMTRLRITVRDDAKILEDALRALPGVLGVIHNQEGYVEIIVGPGKSRKCIDAFRAQGIPGAVREKPGEESKPSPDTVRQKPIRRFARTFGQIFAPLIPGITVSGLCAGFASMIAQIAPGYAEHPALLVLYQLLSGVNAAFMTILPAWAGYRAAEVFGGTPILGGMLGMFTTLENVNVISAATGLYNEAQPLNAVLRAGRGGLLAALIGVFLLCRTEAAIRKRMPDALDTVFTPLLTLFAVLVFYVFLLMPGIGLLSSGLCRLVGFVAMNPNPVIRMIAGYLGAALFLPMVALGMHHGLIALYAVQLETFGYVTLYPALAMAGAGQIGAALALAVKAKRAGNRRLCRVINAALPAAVLGVGEPMIYGVTLPLGRPFLTAGLGAGFGGALVMLAQVASTTWGPSGLPGAFVMTEGPGGAAFSVCCYLAGLAVSCAAAYLITAAAVRDDDIRVAEGNVQIVKTER